MIMKNFIFAITLLMGFICILQNSFITPTFASSLKNLQTLSFTMHDSITIQSHYALVQLTINATSLSAKAAQNTKSNTLTLLKKILPNTKWKTVFYNQLQTNSGAINTQIQLQTRLTQSQIATINAQLQTYPNDTQQNTQQNTHQKMTFKIINYDPSETMIYNAKSKLMIQMYQKIQKYTILFNQKTQTHYQIQSVQYTDGNVQLSTPASPMMFLAKGDATNSSHNVPNFNISKKISISANIILCKLS